MSTERKPEHTWIEVPGIEGCFRIALVFNDSVCVIVDEEHDLPKMPEGTRVLTPVDLDGDLLVEVPASGIVGYHTDEEIEDECEEEVAAA